MARRRRGRAARRKTGAAAWAVGVAVVLAGAAAGVAEGCSDWGSGFGGAGDASRDTPAEARQGWGAETPSGTSTPGTAPDAGGGGETASGVYGEASAALEALPDPAPEGEAPKYSRDEFLPGGWADLDHDGCYTRNEILRRDLEAVTFEDGWCKVAAGRLEDPYTGEAVDFVKAESTTSVQIDHVVPLAQAWRAGAWAWTKERRKEFANDPAELLAVQGAANQSKGDSGPADWLPVPAGRCAYAESYAAVASRYALAIPEADRAALRRVLTACG